MSLSWRKRSPLSADCYRSCYSFSLDGLGSRTKWLGQLAPPANRATFLKRMMGNQYPWYWSAGVLIALFLLSIAILNFSIKSLDRLR